jgi:phosphate transport system substrate-binding protein
MREGSSLQRRWTLIAVLAVPAFVHASAQQPTVELQPRAELRIWGLGSDTLRDSALLQVITKLEAGYQRLRPDVTFTHHRSGDDSALGGLYTGQGDVAFMEREPSYIELDGYQQVITGLKPFDIGLMRGGIKASRHSSPLVIVANRNNPIKQLTLVQLNALFNATAGLNATAERKPQPQSWGFLGLPAPWATHLVSLYGFAIDSAEAQTFSTVAMSNSRRWVCEYHELEDASKVVAAVQHDRYAMGLTTLDAVTADVKVVAVSGAGGGAYLPTSQTLGSGAYPLGRTVRILVRSSKEGRLEVKVREFLGYLLSPEAQAIIAEDGRYLPLEQQTLAAEKDGLQ